MVEQNGPEVIYTRDVADMLGMSVGHVNRLVSEGALPILAKAPGLRGANVFDRAEVEAIAPRIRREAKPV